MTAERTRRPYVSKGLDPRRVNITFDANAFDASSVVELADVERLRALEEAGEINLLTVHSVRQELLHPRTPEIARRVAETHIYTIPMTLIASESQQADRIRAILTGNATPGKHGKDAQHIFDAGKHGGGYFITFDKRILAKREELAEVVPPSLKIVTLAEFFAAYDWWLEHFP